MKMDVILAWNAVTVNAINKTFQLNINNKDSNNK